MIVWIDQSISCKYAQKNAYNNRSLWSNSFSNFAYSKNLMHWTVGKIYIQSLVKEPKDAGLKKNSDGVQKFLDELVKIGKYFTHYFLRFNLYDFVYFLMHLKK